MSVHPLTEHSHDHVYLARDHAARERRTIWVVILTAVMMVAEIAVGLASGSMALLADGFHMATHAGALGVAALAYRYARRHAGNRRFTFGTGKIGDLAGFGSALGLALVAIGILFESAGRLYAPRPVDFADATLVAALGLLVNLASIWLLGHGHHHGHDHHGHGHHGHGHLEHDHHDHHDHHDRHDRHDRQDRHGHDHDGDDHRHGHGAAPASIVGAGGDQDNNFRSAYLHILADALTSVMAIAALLAGRYGGWWWADPLVGALGAGVILQWAYGLLRDSGGVLVDVTEPALEGEVRRRIEAGGRARVTDLHVWRVGPGAHAAIIALVADAPETPAAYKARLKDLPELRHVTVEVEPCLRSHC